MGRRLSRIAVLGATALVLGLIAAPGASAQEAVTCLDLATFAPPDQVDQLEATIVGTNGNDVLRGTAGRDVIAGLAGNDVITGLGGDDGIGGEGGCDLIDGGAGNDFATGQMAEDIASGGTGDDELFGGPANDLVKGGNGNDDLIGNLGNDVLLAGRGDDVLLGDQPAPGGPPEASSFDTCNGQQGTDLAFPDTCELRSRSRATSSRRQRAEHNRRRPAVGRRNVRHEAASFASRRVLSAAGRPLLSWRIGGRAWSSATRVRAYVL